MKIEELIEKYERLNHDCFRRVDTSEVLRDLKQLDELKTGHTDEAPRYVKNILARLRELPLHDREVWLKVIISEFKQDFSRANGVKATSKVKLRAWLNVIKSQSRSLLRIGLMLLKLSTLYLVV